MRHFYLLLLLITISFFSIKVSAQSGVIKGTITDTAVKKPLANATISVVLASDSSLISFARSSDQGSFSVTRLEAGNYLLMVSYTGFDTYSKSFSITETAKEIDAGIIPMTSLSSGMNVVVTAPPVIVRGDTIEYNAGSFKTKTNATVEDLLKKLPGAIVDKDGGITVNGKTITKIMVDGHEFFTNDPKLATKNLTADMVNKVQVFDKKSDKSDFTGFDDGNTEPTINLTLKADKRVGVFGKISAGVGTRSSDPNADVSYTANANLNSFKKGQQLSFIGQSNNLNQQGFSLMDALSFAGGIGGGGGGGNIRNAGAASSLLSTGSGQGITRTHAVGINYNNFKSSKIDLNSSYFFNSTNLVKEYVTRRQYAQNATVDSSQQIYTQPGSTVRDNINHRFNVSLDWRIDSSNSIKIIPSFSYQNTNTTDGYNFSTRTAKGAIISTGTNATVTENDGYNSNISALYRHKFATKGRTFSVQLAGGRNQSNADGTQKAITPIPRGTQIRYDTINRINSTDAVASNYSTNISYTEPLSRRSVMEFNTYYNHSANTSDRKAFDYNAASGNGKYDKVNQSLTNFFDNSYNYAGAGINYRENRKTWNYSAGVALQHAELSSAILGKNQAIKQKFFNVIPNAQIQFRPNSYKNFRLFYSGNASQPSVQQMQPIRDSTDPLNVVQGNPNLKQQFANNVRINYSVFDPYTQKNFFLFGNISQVFNKIVNDDSVGFIGNRLTKYTNVNGTYTGNLNGSYGFPVKIAGIKANANFSAGVNYNHNINLLFDTAIRMSQQNKINVLTLSPRASINYTYKELFDFNLSAGVSWYNTTYSLQPVQNTNYFTHTYSLDMNWYLPGGFTIENDFDYTLNTGRAAGYNPKIFMWNANLTKSVLANKRGELKLNVFDLLNQNQGVVRSASGDNYIQDQTYSVLKRYLLLTFTYSLSKFGQQQPNMPGGMRQMIRTMGGGRGGM